MDMLVVIPARGGSKGIPRKNLVDLNGAPLIAWTVRAALEAKSISRVIVSTDDEEIAECARSLGAEVPFQRPAEISGDDVHAAHVVFHVLDYLKKTEKKLPEFVAMLLATAPLRTSTDIDNCAQLLKDHPECSVISACKLDRYAAQFRYLRDGVLVPMIETTTFNNTQRQDAEDIYTGNGAIFMSSVKRLRENKGFHHLGARAYIMPRERSIDIDEEFDLHLARCLMKSSLTGNYLETGRN